ncbi:hypothetical protein [Kribbella sp. NPDC051620]|uniref:hypothetical protein n=1 Tax=Kribbella sp. NPDC051620 TaxID=3364120 RepID=UPI0037B50C81
MDVHVTDVDALNARTADDWSVYLTAKGWIPALREAGGTEWVLGSGSGSVWVPRSPQMRGYATRVAEILRVLSEQEDRSESEVLFDVTHAGYDVQRLRLLPHGEPGTVGLVDGSDSLAGIKKWVLSGAIATALGDHQLVLPNRWSGAVTTFMSESKLAAPSEGSFIWNVITPIGQRGKTALPLEEDESDELTVDFGRSVTLTLYRATSAVKQAVAAVVDGTETVSDAFNSRTRRGVTANLCEGLVEAASDSHVPYSVDFSWAATHAGPPTDRIAFVPAELDVLVDAARDFRNRAPQENVTIRGTVVRLVRESELRPGEVTIAGIMEDDWEERFGHFWVELSDLDYAAAVRAHEDRAIVVATGDVSRVGNRRRLSNLRQFSVLPADPEA